MLLFTANNLGTREPACRVSRAVPSCKLPFRKFPVRFAVSMVTAYWHEASRLCPLRRQEGFLGLEGLVWARIWKASFRRARLVLEMLVIFDRIDIEFERMKEMKFVYIVVIFEVLQCFAVPGLQCFGTVSRSRWFLSPWIPQWYKNDWFPKGYHWLASCIIQKDPESLT